MITLLAGMFMPQAKVEVATITLNFGSFLNLSSTFTLEAESRSALWNSQSIPTDLSSLFIASPVLLVCAKIRNLSSG